MRIEPLFQILKPIRFDWLVQVEHRILHKSLRVAFHPHNVIQYLEIILHLPDTKRVQMVSCHHIMFQYFALIDALLDYFRGVTVQILVKFFFACYIRLCRLIFCQQHISKLFQAAVCAPVPVKAIVPKVNSAGIVRIQSSLASKGLSYFERMPLINKNVLHRTVFDADTHPHSLCREQNIFQLPTIFYTT